MKGKKLYYCIGISGMGILLYWIWNQAFVSESTFPPHVRRIELRLWADIIGNMNTSCIFPLLLYILFYYLLFLIPFGKSPKKSGYIALTCKSLLFFVTGICLLYWISLSLLTYFFTMEEEHYGAKGILLVNKGRFSDTQYVVYKPIGHLFRLYTGETPEVLTQYLEEKYSLSFSFEEIGSHSYFFIPKGREKLKVRVILDQEFEDNYLTLLAVELFEEYYNKKEMTWNFEIVEQNDGGKEEEILIQCLTEKDIESFSKELYEFALYAMSQEPGFKKYKEGKDEVRIHYYIGMDKTKYTGSFPLAKTALEKEGWKDLETKIRSQYEKQVNIEEEKERTEERIVSEEEVVKNARLIYDSVFQEDGYTYTECYNAKGNFYVDLGKAKGMISEEGAYATRTLVYDRVSKNGECLLFVYYEEYYDESGQRTDLSTKILNFYGIDRKTGKVIPGDKTSWSQVGSKEYREATGE
ncbi:MAG: hypothetical protein HFI78_08930 [Lachnospiraceae bacterium]|jgi:hypothetical protein|nr:hypothetical protein [Lachnospiraceae bacterium]